MPVHNSKQLNTSFPNYGSVYEVNLDPVTGSETGKRRPALVVSNNINNEFSGTVTVLPLTSRAGSKEYPFEVYLPAGVAGLTANSRIKANQIRTIDKSRLVALKGTLSEEYISRVNNALRIHLNIK